MRDRKCSATKDKTANIDAENDTFVQNSIIGRAVAEFLFVSEAFSV